MRTLRCSPAAPLKRKGASATSQRFGGFDEHVVQRGYALTLPQCCDDDAKSAFANCEHAAALALGGNVPIVLQKSKITG
jgi:hypothetical protein